MRRRYRVILILLISLAVVSSVIDRPALSQGLGLGISLGEVLVNKSRVVITGPVRITEVGPVRMTIDNDVVIGR